jgi:anti-sigma factor RsiW
MKFSDETLMAFADGELEEPVRSEVEQAMRADPALAARIAGHKALRANVFGAFAGVLDEPVPARLQPGAAPATIVRLDAARAARQQAQQHEQQAQQRKQAPPRPPPLPPPPRARWSWPQWGALAASLAVGVFAGGLGLKGMQGQSQLAVLAEHGGTLVAHGKLAQALSQQVASAAAPAGAAQIGVSFVDKGGAYCRSFTVGSNAGLACRAGNEWQIALLTDRAGAGSGDYRQAASSTPAAVLDAIDARIAGPALDADAERAALQRGWQPGRARQAR